MPGSGAPPGWFSPSRIRGQPFSQPLLVTPSQNPQPEPLVLESRDIPQEPLNEAVNEEASSLNPSGRSLRRSSPQGLHFSAPLPCCRGGRCPPGLLASAVSQDCCRRDGPLHSRPDCAHPGTDQAPPAPAPGLGSLPACGHVPCSLLWDGACLLSLSLRPEEVAPPPHPARVGEGWLLPERSGAQAAGLVGRSHQAGHRLPPVFLLATLAASRIRSKLPVPREEAADSLDCPGMRGMCDCPPAVSTVSVCPSAFPLCPCTCVVE